MICYHRVLRNAVVVFSASMYGKDKQSIENWTAWGLLRYVNKQARKSSAKWFQLPSDSELRAHSVFTEKDFSDEELGRIVPKFDADSNDIRPLHDGERIVGSYNRATGEVKLAKCASVETALYGESGQSPLEKRRGSLLFWR